MTATTQHPPAGRWQVSVNGKPTGWTSSDRAGAPTAGQAVADYLSEHRRDPDLNNPAGFTITVAPAA